MISIDDFALCKRQVKEALSHLYDPAYHPQELLCLQLGFRALQPHNLIRLIRDTLVQAIDQLQPAVDVPASARVHRIYDLLNLR